jgi:ubiquinone biosynthesis protein
MPSSLTNAARLTKTLFVLARYDVLAPSELKESVPRPLLFLSAALRVLSFGKRRGQSLEDRLAGALPRLGPSYIKIGQLLASRPDLVGTELASALSVLQDSLPPFSMAEAEEAIAQAFDCPASEAFEKLEEPFAAASVAQVHKAWLNPVEGEAPRLVAVKILRPGIRRTFQKDLDTFAWTAQMFERLMPSSRRLEPVKLVETLDQSMRLELDLRLEGAAAAELGKNTQYDSHFKVPGVIWPRTSQRILTTEWARGIALTDTQALAEAGIDGTALALLLVDRFLTHALRDGFFHADMHQGNLFVQPPEETGGTPTLVAVDFGIMGRLSKETRAYLGDILLGFILQDYERVARAHYDAGYISRDFPQEEFAQALRAIGEPLFGQMARDISMAKLLLQLFETTETFNMHLQPQLVLLQKTMMVVEGVARSLDPDHDMWAAAQPAVESFMEQTLGPEAMAQNFAQGAMTLARLVAKAPNSLERVERAAELLSDMTEEGGIRLHPETAQAIAEQQRADGRPGRIALIVAVAAFALVIWKVGMGG